MLIIRWGPLQETQIVGPLYHTKNKPAGLPSSSPLISLISHKASCQDLIFLFPSYFISYVLISPYDLTFLFQLSGIPLYSLILIGPSFAILVFPPYLIPSISSFLLSLRFFSTWAYILNSFYFNNIVVFLNFHWKRAIQQCS